VMTVLLVAPVVVGVAIAIAWVLIARVEPHSGHARLNADGFQELEIVVKGRYRPEIIQVWRGIPLRLYFRREEDIPCSEQVFFSDFHPGSRLLPHQTTLVSFIPTKSGEFLFTCALGMYQGRLLVIQPTRADLKKVSSGRSLSSEEGIAGLAPTSSSPVSCTPSESNRCKEEPRHG